MRQFLGAFKNQPEYVGYDKGHFIAHCNDGQIDQNPYPQLRELNRWFSRIKIFVNLATVSIICSCAYNTFPTCI